MKHRGIRNMLTFLLALVLPAAVVGVLSAATRVPAETARAAQTVQAEQPKEAAGQLTAVPHQESGTSVLAGVGGFLLLLTIPAGSFLLYCRARRRGRDYRAEAGRQSYRPRADMSLRNARFVRN